MIRLVLLTNKPATAVQHLFGAGAAPSWVRVIADQLALRTFLADHEGEPALRALGQWYAPLTKGDALLKDDFNKALSRGQFIGLDLEELAKLRAYRDEKLRGVAA